MTTGSPPFNPTPEMIDYILKRICDCRGSLCDIARECDIDLWALVEWTARPEIRNMLDTLELAMARRVRLMANQALFRTIRLMRSVLAPHPLDPPTVN